MGCGASSESLSRQPSTQSAQRGRVYQRLMLEEENEAGEFVDVTSAAFQQSLPIAPFSFSRPDASIQPTPSVPCLEQEHLDPLTNTHHWLRCGKRRQLYRGTAESRTQNPVRWTLYNDSRDLNCHVKFIFDPDNTSAANSVEVLSPQAVFKTSRDGFITFTISVEPLQTLAALIIPRSVEPNAYMVVYDVEECTDNDAVTINREQSQRKWLAQCRAIEKLFERNKMTSSQVNDAECVKLCVQHNVMFVDQQQSLETSCEHLTPDQFLVPMEADEVRPFRSPVKLAVDTTKQSLCCSRQRYVNLADALFIISKRPEIVQRAFQHPDSFDDGLREREQGAYRLTICDESMWRKEVFVDNHFSISGGKHVGIFRKDPCEVWPQLITKALMKVQGTNDFFGRSALSFVEQLSGSVVHVFQGWNTRFAEGDATFQGYQLERWLGHGHIVAFCDTTNSQLFLLESVYLVPERKISLLRLSCPPWKENAGSSSSLLLWGDESNKILDAFPEVEKEIRRSKPLDTDVFVNLAEVNESLSRMITCFYQPPESNFRVQGTFNGISPPVPSVSLTVRASRTIELFFTLRVPFEAGRRVLLSVFSSSGEAVFGGALRYELLCNSSGNPAKHTSSKFSFSEHSCVLRVRLESSKTPYIVVPRLLSEGEPDASYRPAEHGHVGQTVLPAISQNVGPRLEYVLTIESAADLLSGVEICFSEIDRESKIFDSVDSVLIGNATSALVSSKFQSFGGGPLSEKNGNSLATVVQ
jgi:hypothetical protein